MIFRTIGLMLITFSSFNFDYEKYSIQNGEQNIEFYPEIENVFISHLDESKEVFFPIATVNLGELKEEWKDQKIHLVIYNNKYCKDYMVAFDVINDKYEFKTDYKYFDLTEAWEQWFNETKESYFQSKKKYKETGSTFWRQSLQFGGKPNWLQNDETPLDPDGKPMEYITEFGWGEVQFYLFYCHKHKLAVQVYQIT